MICISRFVTGLVPFVAAIIVTLASGATCHAQDTVVSFESWQGLFVVAEAGGGGAVNANRKGIGDWERFKLEGPSPVRDGSAVNIRTANGSYFSAEPTGSLLANRNAAQSWETFTLINHSRPGGVLADGDQVSLRSAHGRYVVAETDGSTKANRSAIGSWERFTVVAHGLPVVLSRSEIERRVLALYQDILGRQPDAAALASWVLRVEGGTRLSDVARGLFHSAEFLGWSESQQVAAIFRLILLREPTALELSHSLEELRTGTRSLHGIAGAMLSGPSFAGLSASHRNYLVSILNAPVFLDTAQLNNAAERRKVYFRERIARDHAAGNYPMPILAYEGIPLRQSDLDSALRSVVQDETGDFRLAQLVRILALTREYDAQILPVVTKLKYWLTPGEDKYVYWSENHMILWMSSGYLLHKLASAPIDENLELRLNHYLDLKIKYGFYEFMSSTYLPFTLAGLLNLADFAPDAGIRSKATRAANILIKNWLLVTNDQGAFYPAAGRNYASQYTAVLSRSISWITSRIGSMGNGTDYVGAFLATSSIDLREAAASYRTTVDTTFTFGHSQSEHRTIHPRLSRVDRTLFQWSSGGYFHPDVADDTTYLVDLYDLEDHRNFDVFRSIPDFPDSWSGGISTIGATFTRSSDISSASVRIFKNRGTVLTSLDDFYPGYRGYQQWPWVATAGDIAVWTQSGDMGPGWQTGNGLSGNTHLPKVQQDGNVALISYFPNLEIRTAQWLGSYDTQVSLYWPTQRFDESLEWDRWVIGRKGTSYVAVLRDSTDKRNGFYYSNADRGRQMWAVVVGNESTHTSFARFVDVIKAASIKETYDFDFRKFRQVYFTRIDVDGKYIQSSW